MLTTAEMVLARELVDLAVEREGTVGTLRTEDSDQPGQSWFTLRFTGCVQMAKFFVHLAQAAVELSYSDEQVQTTLDKLVDMCWSAWGDFPMASFNVRFVGWTLLE